MKRIIIELEGQWVLRHRDDDELPIAKFEALLQADRISVEAESLTSLALLVDGGVQEENKIVDKIKAIFSEIYPEEKIDDVLTLQIEQVEKKPQKQEEAPQGQAGKPQAAPAKAAEEAAFWAIAETNAAEQTGANLEEVSARMANLVGAAEFKKVIGEIIEVAPQIVADKAYHVFNNRGYLFSIGDGYGLTTYLEVLADTIAATGLRTMHKRPVIEEKIAAAQPDRLRDPFEDILQVLHSGDSSKARVLCIDISEWMGKTDTLRFKSLMREIVKATDKYTVVFRVPFLEKDVLADLNYSLNDLMSVKTVSFPPFSGEDLKLCAERELNTNGFKVSKNAWEFFQKRITEEKSDGRFYGLNTIKKVVREIIYNKHLTNARKGKADRTIGRNDMSTICGEAESALSGAEQLRRLIGNEQVKKQVEEIVAQIEVSVRGNSDERPCIHMRFVGNPGTGKTTVARIIGKILKEKGLLRIGNFYEYAGRDFCGRFVGETAPKTASICRDAYGSVLFIDEAYSLYRGSGSDFDYGREAIDTLIAEMENHRNDFVVIMAGYTDDMETLMRSNQGLASRMPYTIEFPNFTRGQLYEIFVSMVQTRFKYDDALFGAAHAYFMGLTDEVIGAKEFSNARFVRNLFERTWAKAAMRSQLGNKPDVVLTKDDFDRASGEKEFVFTSQKKARIGFY